MANMIVASLKPLASLHQTSPPRRPRVAKLPQFSVPKIAGLRHIKGSVLTASTLSLALAMAPPSLAIEKAALFDFNLTLPIMMAEFLFLMVALDKLYFTPLGKFMDERDTAIKEKLGSVQNSAEEVKQLDEQGAAIMRAARAEIAAALNKMKRETQEELEAKLAERGRKLEAELKEALAALEVQKEETIKALDSQIAALSNEIVSKVLPIK